VAEIKMNEVNPHSLQGLALGLEKLDAPERAKVAVIPGEAGAARSAASDVPIVIADPPRKGLDPQLSDHLSQFPPERLIYISCEIESLRRDAVQLTAHGKLRLAGLTAFNLMPFTEHVETVARLERC
jgi:23S rRNA (uracil1939-C5)-methyltransferase